MKPANDWKERAWASLCDDCKVGGPIRDNEVGATVSGCFRCGKGSDDKEKQEMLKEFRSKMQRVREAQASEADVRALKGSVETLLTIAERDTGQSRRVASFLLAWWNAGECGGFDLTDLWNVDLEIVEDMQRVLLILPGYHNYPDKLGLGERFERLAVEWRKVGA